jgi:hypothetical protein
MAYDASRGQVVLFGGDFDSASVNDTWTWNGTDWTERAPAHSPPARQAMGMAYDAARGQIVLFGGFDNSGVLGDTWTWDGTDWTEPAPAHSLPARYAMGMAYDAGRERIVLYGGFNGTYLGDTWTWDGADWSVHVAASMKLQRRHIAPGAALRVSLWGFAPGEQVKLVYIDSVGGGTVVGKVRVGSAGAFVGSVTVPATATPGIEHVKATGLTSGGGVKRRFTVRG